MNAVVFVESRRIPSLREDASKSRVAYLVIPKLSARVNDELKLKSMIEWRHQLTGTTTA